MERNSVWKILCLFFVVGLISLLVLLSSKNSKAKAVASYFLYGSICVIIVLGIGLAMSGRGSEQLWGKRMQRVASDATISEE